MQASTEKQDVNKGDQPDTMLTQLGHTQAIETGQFLSKYLKEIEEREGKKFGHIIVNSSPFIRTVATGARICKKLGIE